MNVCRFEKVNKSSSAHLLGQDGLLEHIRCPICFDIPSAEIYQCKNGHAICHECLSNVEACPQCRESFADKEKLTRVRALESLVDAVKKETNQTDSENCTDQENSIQLCKKLGYNCDYYWAKIMNLSSVDHFRKHHHAEVVKGDSIGFNITNFTKLTYETSVNSVWRPIFINTSDGLHFIIITLFNAVGRNVSWICLDLNQGIAPVEVDSTIEICIKNKVDRSSPLKWTQRVFGILALKSIEGIQELIVHEVPVRQLRENHVIYSREKSTDVLPIKICVLSSSSYDQYCGQGGMGMASDQGLAQFTRMKSVEESVTRSENVGIVGTVFQKANEQLEQIRTGFFTILDEVFGH